MGMVFPAMFTILVPAHLAAISSFSSAQRSHWALACLRRVNGNFEIPMKKLPSSKKIR